MNCQYENAIKAITCDRSLMIDLPNPGPRYIYPEALAPVLRERGKALTAVIG
jgi:hypothetical protein